MLWTLPDPDINGLVKAKAAPASGAKDGYCSRCVTKGRMCQWDDAEKNAMVSRPKNFGSADFDVS